MGARATHRSKHTHTHTETTEELNIHTRRRDCFLHVPKMQPTTQLSSSSFMVIHLVDVSIVMAMATATIFAMIMLM